MKDKIVIAVIVAYALGFVVAFGHASNHFNAQTVAKCGPATTENGRCWVFSTHHEMTLFASALWPLYVSVLMWEDAQPTKRET